MKLTIEIENDNAAVLAVFLRRVTYEDAYRRANGETEEKRKEMAYKILEAMGDVEKCLNKAGFCPR